MSSPETQPLAASTFDERLRVVFASVLGVDASAVSDDDSSQTIEAWDSLAHLNLIFAMEAEFGVRFEAEEIPDLMSVKAMRQRIASEANGARHD
ncbi:MAG: acyl carrier protein [Gemmatimonadaceae bacterium]